MYYTCKYSLKNICSCHTYDGHINRPVRNYTLFLFVSVMLRRTNFEVSGKVSEFDSNFRVATCLLTVRRLTMLVVAHSHMLHLWWNSVPPHTSAVKRHFLQRPRSDSQRDIVFHLLLRLLRSVWLCCSVCNFLTKFASNRRITEQTGVGSVQTVEIFSYFWMH